MYALIRTLDINIIGLWGESCGNSKVPMFKKLESFLMNRSLALDSETLTK